MLNSTNIKIWISDLRAVSGAVRAADMSVAAIGAVDYAKALDGLSLKQAQLMLTTQGIVGEEQKDLLVKQGLIATSDRMSASIVSEALANNGLNKEKQEELLIDLSLMNSKTKELITENAVTEARLRGILAEKGIKGAKADTLIASILQTGQNAKEAISWDVLAVSIKKSMIALAQNPLTWIAVAAGAVVTFIKVVDHFAITAEKLNDQLQELKATEEELISTQDKLTEIDNKIAEIQSKGTLSITDNADISRLQTEKSLLEDEIELLKIRKELQQDEYNKNAKRYADGQYSNYTHGQGDVSNLIKDYKGYKAKSERTDIDPYFVEDAKEKLKETKADLIEYRNTLNENIANLAPDDEESRKKLETIREAIEKLIYTEEELVKIKFDRFIIDPNNTGISEGFEKIKSDGEVTAQEITDLASKFPTLKKFMDDNGISAETLAAELNNVGTEAENSGGNVNKMTASLSDLEGASDKIGKLSSAFKELSDDGYITFKTLGEIQEATGLSGDEWEQYQTKLLTAKKGSSEFNQTLSDLTYKILDATFKKDGFVNATEDEIAAILRENNVSNASAVAHDYAARNISAEEKAKAENSIKTYLLSDNIAGLINNLSSEAAACGLTETAFKNLAIQMVLTNNTNMSFDAQIANLKALGIAADITAAKIAGVSGYRNTKYSEKRNVRGNMDSRGDLIVSVKHEIINGSLYAVYYGERGQVVDKEKINNDYDNITPSITPSYNYPTSSTSSSPESRKTFKEYENDTSYYSEVEAWLEKGEKDIERIEKETDALNRQFEHALDSGNKDQAEILHNKIAENIDQQKGILHEHNEAHRITQGQLLESLYQYASGLKGKSWDEITEVDLIQAERKLDETIKSAKRTVVDKENEGADEAEIKAAENLVTDVEYNLNQFKGIIQDLKSLSDTMDKNSSSWWELDQQYSDNWKSLIDFQEDYSNEWIDKQKTFNKLSIDEEIAAYGRKLDNNKNFLKQIQEDERLSQEERASLIKYTNDIIEKAEEDHYNARREKMEQSLEEIDKYISARNEYNDWSSWGDSEIAAIRRQMAVVKDAFKQQIISLKEYNEKISEYKQSLHSVAKNALFQAVEKEISNLEEAIDREKELLDLQSSKYNSLKSLLQSYYDVVNSISDAQHEINKELNTSKTLYEYLNEETRKLLFNEKDYKVLNETLLSIQQDADMLQEKYNNEILNATKDNLDEITSKYEMQYETLMKSYEIAKADLEVAKKKQQLNNVLKERNVSMFINGRWQWVANTKDVENAQNELADAEYQKNQAETSLEQTNSLNKFTEAQDEISTQINNLTTDLELIRDRWSEIQEQIEGESTAVSQVLKEIATIDSPALRSSIGDVNSLLSDISDVDAPLLKDVISGTSTGLTSFTNSLQTAINRIRAMVNSTTSSTSSSGLSLGSINKYATGTKNTKPGTALMGEDGKEIYIDNNGHYIPIEQPTLLSDVKAGGTVFNQDQMKSLHELWDMSKFVKMPDYSSLVNRYDSHNTITNNDYSVTIKDLVVDNSADGQALANAIRRYVAVH